jgi:hypothetical protein
MEREVVELLWRWGGHAPDLTYAFVPVMDNGRWVERQAVVAGGRIDLDVWRDLRRDSDGVDRYFTPLLYSEPARRKEYLRHASVIFADDDGDRRDRKDVPPPTFVVRSSPGHSHMYWLLERPYPADEWEPYARGTTLALGTDPGGWDATQVLRVPGSLNWKRGAPFRTEVSVFKPNRVYELRDFPKAVAPAPKTPQLGRPVTLTGKQWVDLINIHWDTLTPEHQYYLTGRPAVTDRSKLIWRLICEMRDQGLDAPVIYSLLEPVSFNKYRDRPDTLWKTVLRAFSPAPAS